MTEPSEGQSGPLERFLNLFAPVRAGEGLLVVVMTMNIFLILLAYYVLKPLRDSLIVNVSLFGTPGDELKSYIQPVLAILLFFVVQGYSELANRVDRVRLLTLSSGFVVASICAFVGLISIGIDGAPIAIAYFLWLGIINVFLIAQFWSFANDIYTDAQGKRLFAAIAIGQSVGAILGAYLTRAFSDYTTGLMLAAAVLIAVSIVLYRYANARLTGSEGQLADAGDSASQPAPMSKDGGFKLLLSSRYLLLIAALILVSNLVNTNGEFIVSNAARTESERLFPMPASAQALLDYRAEQASEGASTQYPDTMSDNERTTAENQIAKIKSDRKGFTNQFFGDFYFWVNLAGFIIQAFIVSRLFGLIGVRGALFVLPVIAFGGALVIGVFGTVLAVRLAKTAENATDYSLQNTVKQALWLPTSREEKYKAKAAIDTFIVRVGDTLSAAFVFVGTNFLAFGRTQFAFLNAALGLVLIGIAYGLYLEHKRRVP